MSPDDPVRSPTEVRSATGITLRYWAAARAAADTPSDTLEPSGPLTLAEVLDRARALHPDARFAAVVAVCSVIVGDQPVGTRDHHDVIVPAGGSVELLPPFAGG